MREKKQFFPQPPGLTNLDGSLGQVVRVPQFGGDVELEVVRVFNGGVTQLDADAASLLECLLKQQRFQNLVKLLLDVLQQHLDTER